MENDGGCASGTYAFLVINGPNINMLGVREPDIYGTQNYDALVALVEQTARAGGFRADCFQSNHEGAIVDAIQGAYGVYDGIVINPAAYTHTSVAILDALKAVGLPFVEVHISQVDCREDFRRVSYIRRDAAAFIAGRGIGGYRDALLFLCDLLAERRAEKL